MSSVLQQGLIIVDADYELTSDVCKDITVDSKIDIDAGIHIGIQAIVGTLWWFLNFFIYIQNVEPLENASNQATLPGIWMWSNLSNSSVGWTAASYFSNFWIYLIVSFGETVAWVLYLAGQPDWFAWWVTTVGWYGVFLMFLPPLFAAFQLFLGTPEGGFAGNSSVDFGNNSVFLLSGGVAVWIQAAVIHW